MGLKRYRWAAIAPLLLSLAACSGNQAAEQWFAADPSLQPAAEAEAEPDESRSEPVATPAETPAAELPDDFPASIPRYPDATLLEVRQPDSQRGARAGDDFPRQETLWQTDDAPEAVAAFYRAQLSDGGWETVQPLTLEQGAIARRKDLELQIHFLSPSEGKGTHFALTYGPPAAAEVSEKPERAAASQFRDLKAGDRTTDYIRDLAALGLFADLGEQFQPERMVSRREFARWLLAAHNQLYRDRPTWQIRPVPRAEPPAFEDVKPGDRDFAAIQGLAEAGIIPSRLTGDATARLFQPDAPLTREQAIAWKVPLDLRKPPPAASLAAIQQTWGFQDAEQIGTPARQALLADYDNGEQANVLRAFGYTMLFQPRKPVTRAEAAAILWRFGYQGEGISAAEARALPETDAETAPTSPSQGS